MTDLLDRYEITGMKPILVNDGELELTLTHKESEPIVLRFDGQMADQFVRSVGKVADDWTRRSE